MRFLIVGGVNTVVGYGLFALLDTFVFASLRFGYLASLLVASAVAIVVAFVLYRRFVFHVTGRVVRDFVAFVGVYAVSLGLNVVLLPALVELVGARPLVAQAVVLGFTTLISFFGHREVSFRRPKEPTTSQDA